MRTRGWLAGGIAAGLAFVGCGTNGSPSEADLAGGGSTTSAAVATVADRSIFVKGEGETSAPPDFMTVQVSVAAIRPTVNEAVEVQGEDMTSVLAALRSAGIADDDLVTRNYSVGTYFELQNNHQVPVGYLANNSVEVTIRDLEAAGSVLDAATVAGGDEVKVDGVNFGIDDEQELQAGARQLAWEDAVARATQLAELSGTTLGDALVINEGVVLIDTQPLPTTNGGSTQTPVEPGQVDVRVTLEVKFAAS